MTQFQASAKSIRFLIADDVTETRRSTRLMLSLIPEAEIVAIAKNGREAVEMAREYKPNIALVDVNMPLMNGLQACRVMVEENPLLVCIIISAERDPQTLIEAMAAGAQGYLTKPFTVDQLSETVQRVWKRTRGILAASATAAPATTAAAKGVTGLLQGSLQAGAPRQSADTSGINAQIRQQRDYFLQELAEEYIRNRRTDEKAMQVLEILSQDPKCEQRLLTALAMIYALNHRWEKLKILASRLEKSSLSGQ